MPLTEYFIRQAALSAGFDACGIAQAEKLPEDALFLRNWLDKGMHGDMHYLNRNFEKRIDPQALVPGCKTVVVVLLNYLPENKQQKGFPKIAKYAYSEIDYHIVMKQKLRILEEKIIARYGEACVSKNRQHIFSDSAPILEKRWAVKAGLGWLGRHTQLIHPKFGSYIFIGILLLNIEVQSSDTPFPFRCGKCRKCIEACPTGALDGEGMNPRKCISYLTLEAQSEIPENLRAKLSGYIVGCDICNDVCPWNKRFGHPHKHEDLAPAQAIFSLTKEDWQKMTQHEFEAIFSKSAIKRAGFERIRKLVTNNN